MPRIVLPLQIKQTFPPTIGIFISGEGDGIKSRLPFKTFSTLTPKVLPLIDLETGRQGRKIVAYRATIDD